MDRVIIEGKEGEIELQTKVISDASRLRPLLNKDCWVIFARLAEKEGYPASLAKELSMDAQKVYYCIKQLSNAGLIAVERTEERNGASAKYYSAAFQSFSVVPDIKAGAGTRVLKRSGPSKTAASGFLSEFLKNGIFCAKIVVGSPDPHGPFKARARDGHLAAELCAFIGANCAGFEFPLVFLDTMVKDLKHENSNLVILGGPVTNKLAEQANGFLPIKFVPSGGNWTISSSLSGKEYTEDSIGIIEKMPHPYFKGKWILVLAGKRNTGTISAIIALTKHAAKTGKPNPNDGRTFGRVVEGLDVNGDGIIDEVEFRE